MDTIIIDKLMLEIVKSYEAMFKEELARHETNFDYNYSYFRYLLIVMNNPGMTQNELGSAMNVLKSSVSKAVRYLINNKLINLVQDESDKRRNCLYITAKGESLAREYLEFLIDLNAKLLEGFSNEEIELFKRMLVRIYKNITKSNQSKFKDDLKKE